jgi:hypothetical protein
MLNDVKGLPIDFTLSDGKLTIPALKGTDMDLFAERFKKYQYDRFKRSQDYMLDEKSKMYLIKYLNKDILVILDNIEEVFVKRCFNEFATIIERVEDVQRPEGIYRSSGNISILFNEDNEIIQHEKRVKLSPIKPDVKHKSDKPLPNPNIGVLDLETYDHDSLAYCYAIGFKTNLEDMTYTYYLDKNLDSSLLIHNCIDEMLKDKYKHTTFYVHNLGGFDAAFIIKALTLFNKTEKGLENNYTFETTIRDSDILKLVIKRKVNGIVRRVKILDSVGILPRSLRDLGNDYKVDTVKGYFPYTFVSKHNLFYKGKTPDISYYNDISEKEYNTFYKEVWDLKVETIYYLEKDLQCLYEVLVKVNKTIHLLFDIQMTEVLTVSGMAMRIFLNKHYNPNEKPIPLINKKDVFEDVKSAYYGGRVEIFNPRVEELCNYYDVNSLYPYASLNIMPGLKCVYVKYINVEVDMDDLFGFFYIKIKTPNNYLGLLPKRTLEGLIYPVGEWEG